MLEKFALIPILGCIFALIVSPLLLLSCGIEDARCLMESRIENKIFWPILATITVILAARHWSRFGRPAFPPHIVCLFVYLGLAGASVLWAFKPEISAIRFAQQAMIVVSIVLAGLLAARSADMMRGLFLCFALAVILNLLFVLNQSPLNIKDATPGYPGYFPGKNYLGECAAVAILLSLHEICHRGFRRVVGSVVLVVAVSLVIMSNSRTAQGLAMLSPFLAVSALLVRRRTGVSLAILPLALVFCYLVVSSISNLSMGRLSYMLYGDSTFTGRQIIWDFASLQIGRKPLFGWGYQSFWLVGPDAPSVVDARGWVKSMPNAHNGYYDTTLEMGYVGLALLVTFICTTLHAIGRVADIDPVRGWLLLSLCFFVMISNGLESTWMRGFEFLWVMFVILATDAARYWQPYRRGGRLQHAQRRAHVPGRTGASSGRLASRPAPLERHT